MNEVFSCIFAWWNIVHLRWCQAEAHHKHTSAQNHSETNAVSKNAQTVMATCVDEGWRLGREIEKCLESQINSAKHHVSTIRLQNSYDHWQRVFLYCTVTSLEALPSVLPAWPLAWADMLRKEQSGRTVVEAVDEEMGMNYPDIALLIHQ